MEIKRTKSSKFISVAALILGVCFTSGYATNKTTTTTTLQQTTTTTQTTAAPQFTFNVPLFSAIDVVGPVQITLLDGQPQQTITVLAPTNIAQSINASVKNNTLMLEAHPPHSYKNLPIAIKINMQQPLAALTIRGTASVNGQIAGSPNLTIALKNSGNIFLVGKDIPLHSVENDSQNDITIQGINSKNVIVRGSANGGKIDLSGQTDELNAQIKKSMTLYAHTLFANTIHINTQDKALAFVCPVDALYGFAYDNSNIYYYHHNPRNVVRDTYISGNVLKMPK